MSQEIDDLLRHAFRDDGAKYGVSDFYKNVEEALLTAIKSGEDFDTHTYGVKKEIQQGRVKRAGETITCSAYVTNDFDEEGTGESSFTVKPRMRPQKVMELVKKHLDKALEKAEGQQNANAQVHGFTILKDGRYYDEYLADVSEYGHEGDDPPPGDSYEKWGFQTHSEDDYPVDVRKQIEGFALALQWLDGEEPPEALHDDDGKAYVEFNDFLGGNTWRVTAWN